MNTEENDNIIITNEVNVMSIEDIYNEINKNNQNYIKLKFKNKQKYDKLNKSLNENDILNELQNRINKAIEYNKKNIHSQTLDNLLQGVDKE